MSDKVKRLLEELFNEWYNARCLVLDMKRKNQDKFFPEYREYVGRSHGLWKSILTIWKHYPETASFISAKVEEIERRINKLYPDDIEPSWITDTELRG